MGYKTGWLKLIFDLSKQSSKWDMVRYFDLHEIEMEALNIKTV